MYFEVLNEIRFRKHPSQSSLYFNGAEYFYRQSWSSNYLFYMCVLYVLYDSWVSTDLSVSIKTTTTTTNEKCQAELSHILATYFTMVKSSGLIQCKDVILEIKGFPL